MNTSPQVVAIQAKLLAMVIDNQDADKPPYDRFRAVCLKNYAALSEIYKVWLVALICVWQRCC
jgi:hypothetical protein